MSARWRWLAALLVGVLAPAATGARAAPGQAGGAEAGAVAIVNAQAHTMTGAGAMEDATILVRDGVITDIAPGLDVPTGARVVDAEGRPVTPGLISSATQLGLLEVSSSEDTVDRSESAGRLGASFDIRYGLNFNSTLIPVARADGLTHGLVFPSASAVTPFAGAASLIDLRAVVDSLEYPGIAMFANLDSQITSGSGQSRSAQWLVLRNALKAARDLGASRSRARPVVTSLEDMLQRADLTALQPVLAGEVPLVIRARRESDIRQAVALGEELGIRVVVFEANEAWRAADVLAAHQVPVLINPTDNLPRSFDEIGSRLDNAALLHEAGVPLGFYVSQLQMSYNAGLELRQAAGIAAAHGLPWLEALRAITAGAASIWDIGEHTGTLAPGRSADLVIWSGDPLEVTTAPVLVMIHGREMSLTNRQTQLRDRYHPLRRDSGSVPGE